MRWSVNFDLPTSTLHSRLSGVLSESEIEAWREALVNVASQVPRELPFRVLSDLRGYEVAEQRREVHLIMREVMPTFLAQHGFEVGFWKLYDATPPATKAAARCSTVAHVHHDRDKMERFNELMATDAERFFDDPGSAAAWLSDVTAPE